MVGAERSLVRRYLLKPFRPKLDNILRCLQAWVGGNYGSQGSIRPLVSPGVGESYQSARAHGHVESSHSLGTSSCLQDSRHMRGQYDSSSLLKESGRYSIPLPVPPGGESPPLVSPSRNLSPDSIRQGPTQCPCRPIEQGKSSSIHRVDSSPRCLSSGVADLGHSPGGSFRHKEKHQASEVLFPSPRPSCLGGGCNAPVLEGSLSLCLSPIQPHQASAEQTQEVEELLSHPSCSMVAAERMVSRPVLPLSGAAKTSASSARPSFSTTHRRSSLRSVKSLPNRVETIKSLLRKAGFSRPSASAIAEPGRKSTTTLYQYRWSVFRDWCKSNGFSASRTKIHQLADFFLYLRETKGLGLSALKGYRSALSSVLRHSGVDLIASPDIRDLFKHFENQLLFRKSPSLNWNLDVVLSFLMGPPFEPLQDCSLKRLTSKTLFLLALATAKRVSELQAFSHLVGFREGKAFLSFLPSFRAKNDSLFRNLPRIFEVVGLADLVGPEDERLLCPVRALRAYLERVFSIRGDNPHLFVSPRVPSRPLSKNAISFFIKELIQEAHRELNEDHLAPLKVRAHDVRGVATSLSFASNLSLSSILEAATWKTHSVFAIHYLKEVQIVYESCRALGPVVSAGTLVA